MAVDLNLSIIFTLFLAMFMIMLLAVALVAIAPRPTPPHEQNPTFLESLPSLYTDYGAFEDENDSIDMIDD
ncbi:MAG: hypothetical protein BAJATHORv1_10586 [Candidatus Thorarchaeota archaeon]|nr:MAG: hypothetical protein BAJATHORv1_10586 [Candidatus Thorarchaeota archaeon]